MEIAAEFYIIIIGLVVLTIMFSIVFDFFPFFQSDEVSGEPDVIASKLAKLAQDCWSNHRSGLDRESAVCFTIDIKTSSIVSEELFTKYLDCEKLPNSLCDNEFCECESTLYDDQDKVRWLVKNNITTIKISYDGNAKKISVFDILA